MSSKYRHLYQFCYVKIFSTNHNRNLVLLDYPGRVRSQITSVVCQIQRFDFVCILVWCPKLESRGTSLEKVSYRNIVIHHTKLGCFGRLTVRATFCTRNIFKKPRTFWEIDIFTCFGPVLYEGSMEEVWLENANLLSEISISGRLVTRRSNFLQSHITLVTYYALFGQLASRRVRRI